MIEALQKAQQEMEEQQQQQQSQPGPPQDPALVDMLAELKMIRSLQQRINKRTKRYADRLLEDPDDPVGQTEDADFRAALQKLGDREEKLQKITRDIVLGKNK